MHPSHRMLRDLREAGAHLPRCPRNGHGGRTMRQEQPFHVGMGLESHRSEWMLWAPFSSKFGTLLSMELLVAWWNSPWDPRFQPSDLPKESDSMTLLEGHSPSTLALPASPAHVIVHQQPSPAPPNQRVVIYFWVENSWSYNTLCNGVRVSSFLSMKLDSGGP